jgi:hypothetical protein
MRTLFFLTGLAVSLASPAWAHWEYTRWGMTPEQAGFVANFIPAPFQV